MDQAEILSYFDSKNVALPSDMVGLSTIYLDNDSNIHTVDLEGSDATLAQLIFDTPIGISNITMDENYDVTITLTDDTTLPTFNVGKSTVVEYTTIEPNSIYNGTQFVTLTLPPELNGQIVESVDDVRIEVDTPTKEDVKWAKITYARQIQHDNPWAIYYFNSTIFDEWTPLYFNRLTDLDDIGITFNSESVYIPAGLYYIKTRVFMNRNRVNTRLYDVTNGRVMVLGQSTHGSDTSDIITQQSVGSGYYEVRKDIEVQLQYKAVNGDYTSYHGLREGWSTWYESDSIEFFRYPLALVDDIPSTDALSSIMSEFTTPTEVITPMSTHSFGNQIVSASTEYHNGSYPAWCAIDGPPNWGNGTYDVWTTALNTAGTDQWIQIQFTDGPRDVNAYLLATRNYSSTMSSPRDWILQGSTDGTSWDNLHAVNDSPNNNINEFRYFFLDQTYSYSFYRLFITDRNGSLVYINLGQFQLYHVTEPWLNTSNNRNTTWTETQLLDSDISNWWSNRDSYTETRPDEIKMFFPTARTISAYEIFGKLGDGDKIPSDWKLLGSNDGSNWITIDEVVGYNNTSYCSRGMFRVSNPNPYRFYSWEIIKNNYSGTAPKIEIAHVKFYEVKSGTDNLTVGYKRETDIIPAITTDGHSGCTITTSSRYSTTYDGLNSFDGRMDTWWLASATPSVGSPEWIKMSFQGKPRSADTMVIKTPDNNFQSPIEFEIQGSNDDSNWDTLGTFVLSTRWEQYPQGRYEFTRGTYYHYRLLVTKSDQNTSHSVKRMMICQILLLDHPEHIDRIPHQVHDWHPDYHLTASSEQPGEEAYKAGNDQLTDDNRWSSSVGTLPTTPQWLMYECSGLAATITGYRLWGTESDTNESPKDWILQGSDDGAVWSDLHVVTNHTFTSGYYMTEYSDIGTFTHRYYRLYITANNEATDPNSYVSIGRWELFDES